jgi:hypothetical protein
MVDPQGRGAVISNVESIRCLEAFGDVAGCPRNVVYLVVIVVEEDKFFAMRKLSQDASLPRTHLFWKAARQTEPSCRT